MRDSELSEVPLRACARACVCLFAQAFSTKRSASALRHRWSSFLSTSGGGGGQSGSDGAAPPPSPTRHAKALKEAADAPAGGEEDHGGKDEVSRGDTEKKRRLAALSPRSRQQAADAEEVQFLPLPACLLFGRDVYRVSVLTCECLALSVCRCRSACVCTLSTRRC